MQLAGSSLVSCDSVKTVPLSTPQAAVYCHLNIFMNKDTLTPFCQINVVVGSFWQYINERKGNLDCWVVVGGRNSQSCHC